MTIARDRTIGILFGNLVVAIVFTQIWPVTIAGRIDPAIAGLLRRRPGLGSEHAEALGTRGGSSGKSRCRRAGDVRFRAGCLSQWRWLDHRPDACRNPAPAGEECVHRCLQHGAVGCRHASTGSRRAWYCTAMIIALSRLSNRAEKCARKSLLIALRSLSAKIFPKLLIVIPETPTISKDRTSETSSKIVADCSVFGCH
jgi:hypothetical protein